MKKIFITAIAYIAILLALRFLVQSFAGNFALDIQLHDTYFVLSYASVVIPVLLGLTFLFSLAASVNNRFQHRFFKTLLFISGIGLLVIFFYFYLLINGFVRF